MAMVAAARLGLPVDPDPRRLGIAAAFAVGSTTIDLRLKLFPRAHVRRRKAGIEAHVMLDLTPGAGEGRHGVPAFMRVSDAKTSDVSVLDRVALEAGALHARDRGYVDVARLYRKRWRIELLFKRMKQHLRIKALFGTSPAAVQAQLWVAVIVYALVQRHGLAQTPNEIAQILRVVTCEQTPVNQAFSELLERGDEPPSHNPSSLFEF